MHICNLAVPMPAKGGQCASTLTCNAAVEAAGWHHVFWWVVLHPSLLIQPPSEWKKKERWWDRKREINTGMYRCISVMPGSLCYMEHEGDISLQPQSPLLSPAAITTSKHLLHLQGRLCCAWRVFLFQVTQRAVCCIVMTGCVKYNAIILGVSVNHNYKMNLKNSCRYIRGIFFSIEIRHIHTHEKEHCQSQSISFLWD